MKIKSPLLGLSFILASQLFAAEQYTVGNGELADTPIWNNTTLPTSAMNCYLQSGNDFTINKDLSMCRFGTNWTSRENIIRMIDEATGMPANHALTIGDGTNDLLIDLRANSGLNEATNSMRFVNGTYNFVRDSGEIKFSTSTNTINTSKEASKIVKVVEFQADTNVFANSNLFMGGTNKDLVDQSYYIFDGNFTAIDSASSTYKQVSTGYTNFEIGGNFNCARVAIWGASHLNIKQSGTLTSHSNGVQIEDASKLTLAGNMSATILNIATSANSATITSTGQLAISDRLNVEGKMTIDDGGYANIKTALVANGGLLTINGAVENIYTGTATTPNFNIQTNSKVVIGQTGGLYVKGGWGNLEIRTGGVLEVNSAEGTLLVSGRIRVADGGRLVLNSTNAYIQSEGSTQSSSVIWFYDGAVNLDINADNDFSAFAFTKDSNTKITIGAGVNTINLSKIVQKLDDNTIGGLTEFINGSLEIEGFKLNTIKIASTTALDYKEDGFLAITATDWENFYIDDNGFLAATAIPEPAVLATIIGALSLAIVVSKRRKQ